MEYPGTDLYQQGGGGDEEPYQPVCGRRGKRVVDGYVSLHLLTHLAHGGGKHRLYAQLHHLRCKRFEEPAEEHHQGDAAR